MTGLRNTDRGTRTALSSRRQKTRYPGVYYRQRRKGRAYEISYQDSLGRRIFEVVPGGEKDAVRARNQRLEKMSRGELVAPSKRTVSELADLYLDSAVYLRPSTKSTYDQAIRNRIKPRMGHMRVSDLSRRAVAQFAADLDRDGYRPWSTRGTLTVLSRMCAYAVEEGWLGVNPVPQLDRHQRPKGFETEMRILSTEEIHQLLRHATDLYRPLFRLLVFSGLRISEALSLDMEDVDWDAVPGRAKDDEPVVELIVRRSKTTAGVRRVAVPNFVARDLAGLPMASGAMFRHKTGNRMKKRAVQSSFQATWKRAGIGHVRLHDLRHTYASMLIGRGEDVTYVARQMGHTNSATTLRIYAKLFNPEERTRSAMERLNQTFMEVGR